MIVHQWSRDGAAGGHWRAPLGFKVSIARQNFGQFHIFRLILLNNYILCNQFWAANYVIFLVIRLV